MAENETSIGYFKTIIWSVTINRKDELVGNNRNFRNLPITASLVGVIEGTTTIYNLPPRMCIHADFFFGDKTKSPSEYRLTEIVKMLDANRCYCSCQ